MVRDGGRDAGVLDARQGAEGLLALRRGDAEAVLGLPAKLAVAAQGLCPNLVADGSRS